MKKNYITLAILAIILTSVFILPAFHLRISSEFNHKTFTVALDLNDVLDSFDERETLSILNSYIDGGVSAIVLRTLGDKEFEISSRTGLPIAIVLSEDIVDVKNIPDNVKYILLKNGKYNDIVQDKICSLIADRDFTVVLCENLSQLSNEMPDGYSKYIDSSDGKILRCYETLTTGYATDKNYDSIYYQMTNSAIDRNTEFIVVNQLEDDTNPITNANRTINSIKRFVKRMTSLGYIQNKTPDLSSYVVNSSCMHASISALSVIMILAMHLLLTNRKIHLFGYLLIPTAFIVTFFIPESVMSLFPTAYSILMPCFCFSICYKVSQQNIRFKTAVTFGLALLSLMLCAIYLSVLLSGINFYMNNLVFRGVIATLIFPVLFAVVLYFYENKPDFKCIKTKHICFCFVIICIGAIYLLRSGNSSISEFERMFRDRIVDMTVARPRTKEFLLGWPALAVLSRTNRYKHKSFIRFSSVIGSSILFASVTNSFCHVFTDVSIIYTRTLNGLLFSLPIVLIALILSTIILKKDDNQ